MWPRGEKKRTTLRTIEREGFVAVTAKTLCDSQYHSGSKWTSYKRFKCNEWRLIYIMCIFIALQLYSNNTSQISERRGKEWRGPFLFFFFLALSFYSPHIVKWIDSNSPMTWSLPQTGRTVCLVWAWCNFRMQAFLHCIILEWKLS